MARIRTIKPDTFTDEKFVALSPLARLLYIALWCEADREGRLEWNLKTLKWKYLPADDCDIEKIGKELIDTGRVVLYTCESKIVGFLPTFLTHQHINVKEQASKLPAPPGTRRVKARASPVKEDTQAGDSTGQARGERKGKERKGREGKEGTTPIVPKAGDEYSEDFRKLVGVYPKRQGTNPLPRAWKAFNAALTRGATIEILVAAAQAYARTEVAGTKFCQQLATWLNGDEWKTAPASTSNVEHFNPEESLWRARCLSFAKPSKFWDRNQWGPAPGEPGCKAPAAIIERTNAAPAIPHNNLTMVG
jgi:hypothetical protein